MIKPTASNSRKLMILKGYGAYWTQVVLELSAAWNCSFSWKNFWNCI